eukprot:CAMPEP_0203760404 /NCGR_PEP_ID=MMETSP0098-20131031/13702_1 /ASSEMBLY_ACC=CAM_ASM_000208 /TAXON_ID=96639 /ORGANISM=" , Strain NY0313808BC1" /LENGTH=474 /DNA_ID=CAMNT_0050653943 /DNA_START=239 /DNA_END=1663 /DNA_ORIENTATION=-
MEKNTHVRINTEIHSISQDTRYIRKQKLSRHGSFRSKSRLSRESKVPDNQKCEVAERLLSVFNRFDVNMDRPDDVQEYFWSQDFAKDFLLLCTHVKGVFQSEERLFKLRGPVHVFGDIHGNLEDLFFFRNKLWPQGMGLTAGKFLFLGDYVDRGMEGLEVLTFLFASKMCTRHKIFMLRGNHELPYVNGWEAHYKERSFLSQCKARFGKSLGERVWRGANEVFDYLPMACTIDEKIFCSHGGIPRQRQGDSEEDTRLEDIANLPVPARLNPLKISGEDFDDEYAFRNPELSGWKATLAMDLLWGDPCPGEAPHEDDEYSSDDSEQENRALDEFGFGPGHRGGAAIMFGQRAVDDFFERFNFSVMLRAHQASLAGVHITKEGKIITVFSTSKDHGLGENSSCAYLLVEDLQVTVVNRDPYSYSRTRHRRHEIAAQEEAPKPGFMQKRTSSGKKTSLTKKLLFKSPISQNHAAHVA